MKTINTLITIMVFLALATTASALPISLGQVEIDGTTVYQNAPNVLSLERGQDYEIRVQFTASQHVSNVELRAFITGYEFSDVQPLEDRTQIFDVDANVTYPKKLHVRIPDNVDQDQYKLHIILSDRFNDQLAADYNIQIDAQRNALKIEDIILNPSSSVRAGSSLLARVRVENKGKRDQDDVRVTVAIPSLGISGTQYITSLKSNDQDETEEILLRIPRCTQAGTYDASIDVEFSQRYRKVSDKRPITVLEDETCTPAPQQHVDLGNQEQTITAEETASFPLTVTNPARTSKTFIVSAPSNDWASITITPTSTLVLPAGQSQIVYVNVKTTDATPAGANSLVATVSNGNAQQQITLTTTVIAQSHARSAFEVILIVLIALLLVIGIVIAIAYSRNRKKTETYY